MAGFGRGICGGILYCTSVRDCAVIRLLTRIHVMVHSAMYKFIITITLKAFYFGYQNKLKQGGGSIGRVQWTRLERSSTFNRSIFMEDRIFLQIVVQETYLYMRSSRKVI